MFNDLQKANYHIAGIVVSGLTDQARDELLATLPVHEGDDLSGDGLRRVSQSIKAFDEHLSFSLSPSVAGMALVISAGPPTREAMEAARRQALGSMSPDSVPPPPPPPPSAGFSQMSPPERIKVGGNVQGAMIVRKEPPVYPESAKIAGVQGTVRLAALIAKDGTMQELHALGGPALLIQAAMDAVRQWVYKPTLLNGAPVVVETTIDVNFTLNQ
jgi:protein TonB